MAQTKPPGYTSEYNVYFCNAICDVVIFVSSASMLGILLQAPLEISFPGTVILKKKKEKTTIFCGRQWWCSHWLMNVEEIRIAKEFVVQNMKSFL